MFDCLLSKKTFQYNSWNHFPSKALKQRTILSMKKPTKNILWSRNTSRTAWDRNIFANFFLHQITGGHWKKSISHQKENDRKISERTPTLVGKCVESINKLTHSHLNITSLSHSKILKTSNSLCTVVPYILKEVPCLSFKTQQSNKNLSRTVSRETLSITWFLLNCGRE